MRKQDREFAERLLAHYCDTLDVADSFHYEVFYDWLAELRADCTLEPRLREHRGLLWVAQGAHAR